MAAYNQNNHLKHIADNRPICRGRHSRPYARRAQPLEVSLQGDLEFEQILYDNLRGPPVRPSQASAHSNRSE
jgi:hypothetical protein